MKLILNGQNNELSFVKDSAMSDIAFTIKLNKIIGGQEYVFDNLYDKYEFDAAKGFIGLDLDISSQEILGGEYKLEIYDDIRTYGNYICLVEDYTFENSDSNDDLFSSTVKISNL